MTVSEKERLLRVAVAAVNDGGAYIYDRIGRIKRVTYKGRTNPVTDVDTAVERRIVSFLRTQTPRISILGEESTDINTHGSAYRWVLDPIDGTVNFAHQFPFFCVSLGLERLSDHQVIVGAVYDVVRKELFSACAGKGAFLNGKRIGVSATRTLGKALLVTGFPYDQYRLKLKNLRHLKTFLRTIQGVRRTGSAALDLCSVASGRVDGYWEMDLNAWDTAAGILMVREAGGRISDLEGKACDLFTRHIVASNGRIHAAMINVLKR